MAGNLANLQKATAARTAAATARAEAALTATIKAGEPVTFRGLAARALLTGPSSTGTATCSARSTLSKLPCPPPAAPLAPPSPAPRCKPTCSPPTNAQRG